MRECRKGWHVFFEEVAGGHVLSYGWLDLDCAKLL